ncbi:response regulator [Thalassotalea sp. PS06]|uniref:response regulator n=1 Tax=Thalassotalea sp. PS06 TaxID=2594005 RepID=UPI001162AC94|nr:response regulator [Thalassotalea sp. PS06]QDP00775.1 response regulator [Thalassotalea sp. PS06]
MERLAIVSQPDSPTSRLTKSVSQALIILCTCSAATPSFTYATEAPASQSSGVLSEDSLASRLQTLSTETDSNKALAEYDKILADTLLDDVDKIQVLRGKGMFAFQFNNLDMAIAAFGQAKLVSEAIDDVQQQAEISKMLGVFRYYRGDNKLAIKHYNEAIPYYVAKTDFLQQANLLNNIGLANTAMARYELALNAYEQAEPLYLQYGDKADQIDVRFNIGGLYVELNRYDVAIESFLEVKAFRETVQDLDGLALVHSDLGIAYKCADNFELAEKFQLLAYEHYKANDKGYDIATQGINLAGLYNEFGEPEKARPFALLGIEYGTQYQHYGAVAGSYYELARVNYVSGEHDKAFANLEQANTLAKKVDDNDLLEEILQLSALVNAAVGNYQQAQLIQQQFARSVVESSNNELNEKLAEFETQQLKQRITQLEAQDKLSQLEFDKANQARNFIVFILIFITIILLLLMQKKRSREAKAELETMVDTRTEELLQTTKELEEANRIKNQFLANVTHEIRTPLSVVIGNAEALLNDEVQSSEKPKHYQQLYSNSLFLLEIVNDILDLSKIEANQIKLIPKPVLLVDLFTELEAMFAEQARQKGLNFKVNFNFSDDVRIHLDAMRFNQILFNLCSNAIKFTEQGSVTVDVLLHDGQLQVTVTDTGIGMDAVQVEQVFGCFVQGDNSISRRFGGSGLGLYLVSNLCQLMDAKIDVDSRLGTGSVFSVSLPVAVVGNHGVEKTLSASVHAKTAYQFNGRVLVAEDHPDNRALIRLYLQRLGIDVSTVCDGLEAIQWLQNNEVDLVFMDIQMPNLDGFSALTRLSKSGFSKPVYAFTANAMSHEIEHYLNVGFSGYIEKPLNRENIIDTLKKHLPYEAEKFTAETHGEQHSGDAQIEILATSFVASAKTDINSICLADEQQDWQAMSDLCHKLCGAAQMFGFVELADASRRLELSLINRRFDKKRPLLLELKMLVANLSETSSA